MRAKTCIELLMCLSLVCTCTRKPSQALLVAGSANALPFLREIATSFKKVHPEAILTVEAGGSYAALVALLHKAVDFAVLSRDLDQSEEKIENIAHPLALDAAILVVHPTNLVAGLKLGELAAMVTGGVVSWSGFGGPSGVVHIVMEKEFGAGCSLLSEMVLRGDVMAPGVTKMTTAEDVIDAVAADPLAMGCVGMKGLGENSVRAIQINGVRPSKITILSGRYPLTRTFFLVHGLIPSAVAASFLAYLRHPDSSAIFEKFGLLPAVH